ncbi:MAG: glycine/betaine/sarcosine/D-proline family reductase selenoprotein B [Eubacteriales bacterium]|nr:glycine/betaine/sarcosine/D-proline family reductase selenoprotein B [Eubacteriales bacterium]
MKPLPVYSRDTDSSDEDYKPPVPLINYGIPAPKRCVSMLLAKYKCENYHTEVDMYAPVQMDSPVLKVPLSEARIIMITDGGLVPVGNPDRIPPTNANSFGIYSFGRCKSLESGNYEVSHQGYCHNEIDFNPNRLLPVDILSFLTDKGVIGELYPYFVSTTGVMVPCENAKSLGSRIADFVKKRPIDAAIIVSTCATSTRCGSYIGIALENKDIPAVQITNLTDIAKSTGMHRVISGDSVDCPIGNSKMSSEIEWHFRQNIVLNALNTLTHI